MAAAQRQSLMETLALAGQRRDNRRSEVDGTDAVTEDQTLGRGLWDYAKGRDVLSGSEAYGRLREGLL